MLRCKYCGQEVVIVEESGPSFVGDIDNAERACEEALVPDGKVCVMDLLRDEHVANEPEVRAEVAA